MVFAKSVSSDMSATNPADYDMLVVYNKADVASLKENFPDFVQGDTALIVYGGEPIRKAVTDAGLSISLSAPNPECKSVIQAIEQYLQAHN